MEKQIVQGVSVLLISAFLAVTCLINGTSAEAKSSKKSKLGKVLIVYYSFSGNTALIAEAIKEQTGGEVVEIIPVDNYNRPDLEAAAKKQVNEGYKPKLKNKSINLESYDTIFIGSPVWWFSYAPPVGTFLYQHDFKGKKVVPFCTHISVYGGYFNDVDKACPGAKVLPGRDFKSAELNDMKKVGAKIEVWLGELE